MQIGRLFHAHGGFCASHPWEVIVALITLTACMLFVDKGTSETILNTSSAGSGASVGGSSAAATARHRQCQGWNNNMDPCEGYDYYDYNAVDVILMTIVRLMALLYCYYQFRNLHKLGSKSILGIAVLFTVFSSFIFTSSVINFFGSEISDLKDALFFFLLLIDLAKAGVLAQLALCGSNQVEVTRNIARGMELLGPGISLDTLVETLVIGVGTLSGVQRVELLSGFAVMSVIVNYVVFMTFYPACLSLILDLSRSGSNTQSSAKESLLIRALSEEDQKPNPVVQRVKVIMSSGLLLVHAHSRLTEKDTDSPDVTMTSSDNLVMNKTDTSEITTYGDYIMRVLSMSTEQIVILILLVTLVVKLIFFDRNELLDQLATIASKEAIPVAEKATQTEAAAAITATSTSAVEKKNVSIIIANNDDESETEITAELGEEIEQELINDDEPRSLEKCLSIMNSEAGAKLLTDDEIKMIIKSESRQFPLHKIESFVDDPERGVKIRRQMMLADANLPANTLNNLSYQHYDYKKVMNACCENVLGYVQIPVGYAGPLTLDGVQYYVPMATTEGALVASTNRGCKAISCRGVTSFVEDVGMTRAPCVSFPSILRAAHAKRWMETKDNYDVIKAAFDSTSRFARLQELLIAMDGRHLYIRFKALTGDAMGMNMVSKGAEMALRVVHKSFSDMQIISLSGNFCSDKKPAAINWIKGRGKRVVCETIIPADKLRSILKTNAKTLVQCNKLKNLSGSAMAGSIGGNNAHAANMVTAVFIATGQDPAQNVTSSNCSTNMELCGDNEEDLYLSCTMPSLEVGTVGGGTVLPGQGSCLDVLGVRGAHITHPGENAKQLGRIICATVMAGELSLMAALVTNDLVKSHMRHNRSSVAINPMIQSATKTS